MNSSSENTTTKLVSAETINEKSPQISIRSYIKKKKNPKQINVYMNQEDILNGRLKQSKKEK